MFCGSSKTKIHLRFFSDEVDIEFSFHGIFSPGVTHAGFISLPKQLTEDSVCRSSYPQHIKYSD